MESFGQSITRNRKVWIYFTLFIGLFVSLMTFVEIRNGKFWTNDLLVYFGASNDFFSGLSPYQKPYGLGSGFFKYPPPTLYLFWPLKLFGYGAVQYLHVLTCTISYVISAILLHYEVFNQKSSNPILSKNRWVLWLSFVLIAIHLVREFHLGNINLQLLLLFTLGYVLLVRGKEKLGAFCWAFAILFKPFFIIFIIPLFLKRWRFVLIIAGFGMLFSAVPALFLGINEYIILWREWFLAIIHHGDYQVNYDAFSTIVFHYFGIKNEWGSTLILLALVMILIMVDVLRNNCLKDLEWVFVLLALTPNFFKTDTQHFMFSLPFLFLLIHELIEQKKAVFWMLFSLLMAGFSLNSNDLLGKQLGRWVTECGFLGISNLLLVMLFILLRNFYPLGSDESEKKVVI